MRILEHSGPVQLPPKRTPERSDAPFGKRFETRYDYRPWLIETFVSLPHDGASLRAANWQYLGKTADRGRQDRRHQAIAERKAIFLYELAKDWQSRLRVAPATPLPVELLGPADDLNGPSWAAVEFSGASWGDARLSQRLVKIAGLQAEKPKSSFPAAAHSDRAQINGHYRFVDQPENSAVTPAAILQPHRARTWQRMAAKPVVLCLQDGTTLIFSSRPGGSGLGVIGSHQTRGRLPRFESPFHLGNDSDRIAARNPRRPIRRAAHQKQAKPRKTERWLEGVRNGAVLARELTSSQLVYVMDRKGDAYEIFAEQLTRSEIDWLVRAKRNRQVVSLQATHKSQKRTPKSLLKPWQTAPIRARMVAAVDWLTPRPKKKPTSRMPRSPKAQRLLSLAKPNGGTRPHGSSTPR